VLLSHKRIGVVRYVGEIAEYVEKGIWYGIEIRMTQGVLGDTSGTIGTTQYFRCPNNEGLFVKLQHILRRIEPKELLEKVVKLTKSKSTLHSLLNQSNSELSKLKKKLQRPISRSKSAGGRGKRRAHSKPTLDDTLSGSRTYTADDPIMEVSISDAPHSSLEFSISNDNYSVTNDTADITTKSHGTKIDLSDVDDEFTLHTAMSDPVGSDVALSDAELVLPSTRNIQQHSAPVPRTEPTRSYSVIAASSSSEVNRQKMTTSSSMNRNTFTLQTALPIQVASQLKTNNNHTRLTRSETQPAPQLMVAIHNELSPSDFAAKNAEIGSWSTLKVIEWIKSFAGRTLNEEWKKVIRNLQRHQITGAELLSMDETDLLTEQLRIGSPEIRYKIMSQLALHYKRSAKKASPQKTLPTSLKLTTSTSSISEDDFEDAKVTASSSITLHTTTSAMNSSSRPHAKTHSSGSKPPFRGYHRLSLSSSRSGKPSKKNHEESNMTATTSQSDEHMQLQMHRFSELHKLFDEIDRSGHRHGQNRCKRLSQSID